MPSSWQKVVSEGNAIRREIQATSESTQTILLSLMKDNGREPDQGESADG